MQNCFGLARRTNQTALPARKSRRQCRFPLDRSKLLACVLLYQIGPQVCLLLPAFSRPVRLRAATRLQLVGHCEVEIVPWEEHVVLCRSQRVEQVVSTGSLSNISLGDLCLLVQLLLLIAIDRVLRRIKQVLRTGRTRSPIHSIHLFFFYILDYSPSFKS